MNDRRRFSPAGETATLLALCGLLVVIAAVFASLSPGFRTGSNLLNLFKHMSVIALVGLGLTFVIAVGFADMSFHFVSCLSGMTMSYMIARGLAPVPAILIAIDRTMLHT